MIHDHRLAAELIIRRRVELGHKHIAFMKGQPFGSDSSTRWAGIVAAAKGMRVSISRELTVQLDLTLSYPELGYGAIRALRDANVRVPEDLSVIGFGDIQLAAFHTPRLTTIRRPLREKGKALRASSCNVCKASVITPRNSQCRPSSPSVKPQPLPIRNRVSNPQMFATNEATADWTSGMADDPSDPIAPQLFEIRDIPDGADTPFCSVIAWDRSQAAIRDRVLAGTR